MSCLAQIPLLPQDVCLPQLGGVLALAVAEDMEDKVEDRGNTC
jgi:hypothetical protein